jgi:hypothetical protein
VTPTILDADDFQDLMHVSLRRKLEAEEYIGERRLQIIDRRWTGSARDQARTLEDTGTTVEDLDSLGEYEMPTYRRAPGDDRSPQRATAPTDPGDSR